jgi:DNA replication protein DnaC
MSTDQCPKCGDGRGWIHVDNGPGRATTVKRCEDCAEKARGFAPGVPVEEQEASFEKCREFTENREALRHAQYFVDGIHPGLYLHGPTGTGKTKIACCAINAIHKAAKRQRVLFVRVPELMLRIQPDHGGMEDGYFDRASEAAVLVLDDVGASQGTDFARRMLQTLCDRRLDAGLRTIWTSNLNLDELAEFLGDARLSSRIIGSAKVVLLDGKDQRLTKRKARAAGQLPLRG